MNYEKWDECIRFHGHSCPGLAIGYRVSEFAMEVLGIPLERAYDEELVCLAENETCSVDAIQYLLSCTVGKGNLVFKPFGKAAYTFYNRRTGEGTRIVVRPLDRIEDRNTMMRRILDAESTNLMEVKSPQFPLPERSRIFENVICESCGEQCREDKVRLQDGRKLCLACFQPYDRG